MNEELKIIISAEIDKLKSALANGKKEVETFSNKAKAAFKGFNDDAKKMGDAGATALKTTGGAIAAAGASLLALGASTEEYRQNQAKLNTAFTEAGAAAGVASQVYTDLYKVLGDDATSVEAANHLAQLSTNQQDLSQWTTICQGVYATFGDSLPIESLTEAANETAKTGSLTGALADALNWAGVSEDAFAASLAACATEGEREQLIRTTLNGLYSEAAATYGTTAAAVMNQNEAEAKLNANTAALGAAIAPVITAFTNFASGLIGQVAPAITKLAAENMPRLQSALDTIAGVITSVSSFVREHSGVLGDLAAVILTVAAAWAAYNKACQAVNAVMALLNMNPVVLGITALIAVIVLCVRHWDEIKQAGKNAWEVIKNTWNNVGQWFGQKFQQAVSAIKSAFSGIVSFFSGIWQRIKQIFSDVGTAIAEGIKGAVSTAVNKVLNAACRIINGFISAINSAIGVINAIPGVNISKINQLTVPAMAKGGVVDSATLALIGERGKEAVVPLENNLEWLNKLAGMLNDKMGGGSNKPIVLQVDGKTFAQVSCDSINALTRHRGSIPLVLV